MRREFVVVTASLLAAATLAAQAQPAAGSPSQPKASPEQVKAI
jgi:hypothetical protein